MILYTADKTSVDVERDIIESLGFYRTKEDAGDAVCKTYPNLYKITIEVEQLEPPL